MSWDASSYIVTLSADSQSITSRGSLRLTITRGSHAFGPLAYANINTVGCGAGPGIYVANTTPVMTAPGSVAQVAFDMLPEICQYPITPVALYRRGSFVITATSNVDGVPLTASATVKVQ